MFIRRTQTRTTTTGEVYFTHRLVRSERVGDKVRQRTLLNLGRHFDAAQSDWPALCRRIEEVLGGQLQLATEAGSEQCFRPRHTGSAEPLPSAVTIPPSRDGPDGRRLWTAAAE